MEKVNVNESSASGEEWTSMRSDKIMTRTAGIYISLLLVATMSAPSLSQSLESITRSQEGRSMRASSGRMEDNADSAKFAIGETKTIAHLEGPGKITHIWLVPSSMDIRYPRALVLRMYWDGSDTPSVETPFGDFFAAGEAHLPADLVHASSQSPAVGKVVGGGMPAAAFGGKAGIMSSIAPDGPVYQAGTLSGNPVAMAAGHRLHAQSVDLLKKIRIPARAVRGFRPVERELRIQ